MMLEPRCPDDERLAAFVDGRLGRADRRIVAAHVDSCPPCREVVAETVAVAQELPRIAEHREAHRPWLRYAAAAAVILGLAATAALVLQPGSRPPTPPAGFEQASAGGVERYVERAARLAEDASAQPRPPVPRAGYGLVGESSPSAAAFDAGRRLIELEIARVRGEASGAERSAATRLAAELERAGHGAALELGAWAELGRIALAAGAARLPAETDFGRLRARLPAELPSGVGPLLEKMEAIVAGNEELSDRDRRRLERLLDDLVELMER